MLTFKFSNLKDRVAQIVASKQTSASTHAPDVPPLTPLSAKEFDDQQGSDDAALIDDWAERMQSGFRLQADGSSS